MEVEQLVLNNFMLNLKVIFHPFAKSSYWKLKSNPDEKSIIPNFCIFTYGIYIDRL